MNKPTFPRVISSLFKELPGDNENFHKLASILSDKTKDNEERFSPMKHIKIIDCIQDTVHEFHGRAYLGSNNKIQVCGNAVWKMFLNSDRFRLQQLLLHELVHFYDKQVLNWNLYNAKQLTCSEIRAYNLSGVCNGSNLCIFDRVNASLSMATATRFMENSQRTMLISSCFNECMSDKRPLEEKETRLETKLAEPPTGK